MFAKTVGTVMLTLEAPTLGKYIFTLLIALDHSHSLHDSLSLLPCYNLLHASHCFFSFLFQLIGPQFIYAIAPALGDRWTPEMESAWSDLFKFISYIIKEAMLFY